MATSVERTVGAADPMVPVPYVVERFIRETQDTFSLELEPFDPTGELRFLPGQFNMLYVFGVGEVPISISGDAAEPRKLIHTTREVGVVTRAMRSLKPGHTIGVRGPFGTSWPMDEAKGHDVILVAGGIGLAPLRPALYWILRNRDDYGKVVLLYGTRSPEDILYSKELAKWRSQFDLEVYITVDRATTEWRGNVGVVTKLIGRAPFDPSDTVAMVCGPEIMMRFAVEELARRGVSTSDIYVSMERNMKCGIGLCGHCQLRGEFVCKDGPVYRFDVIEPLFLEREL
ncbi:MAG TPA: Ni/Fe hydrogenase subunit gamma [Armatimonadetes bacterium]|nr:FAD/NAD(P)-binding protein [Armatimonadota bacterium]MCA1996562.1 FAD/NAD(P)-binding protein [Armatimonadota bacterium]HCE01140.1 Ni/Fe hydrogenase subunit gamma [Armatimonadota bacterium]